MECNMVRRCSTNMYGFSCLRAWQIYRTESLHPPRHVPTVPVQVLGDNHTVCCLVSRLFCSTAPPSTCPPDCSTLHSRTPLYEFLERSHFQCNVQTPRHAIAPHILTMTLGRCAYQQPLRNQKRYKNTFESATNVWVLIDVISCEGVVSSQLSAILPL